MQQKLPVKKIGLPLRPGDSFGELALLYSVPSSVRVTWKADSTWFVVFFFFFRVEVVLKKDDYSKEFQFQDLGRLVKWFFIGQSSPRCGFGLRCFAVVSKHLRSGSMLFRFFAAIHDLWNAMLIWCHGGFSFGLTKKGLTGRSHILVLVGIYIYILGPP